jgi:hypothetical protein
MINFILYFYALLIFILFFMYIYLLIILFIYLFMMLFIMNIYYDHLYELVHNLYSFNSYHKILLFNMLIYVLFVNHQMHHLLPII